MAFLLRTFLLSVFASVYCEEVFNITRTTELYHTDKFIIPKSMCNRTFSPSDCGKFHKQAFIHARKCECYCPHQASTFGFNSGSWSCLNNTKFRRKAGCTYKFPFDYDSFPLIVMATRRQYSVSLPSDSCKTDISSSTYLDCDGSWSTLGKSENSDIFQLKLPRNELGPDTWYYTLKITKKSPSLAGRVVRLQLNCAPPSKSSCILFKIAGKISCPVDPTKKSNAAAGGRSGGGSSGTVAAVVIIIILVIIVAAIIAFIIWKRRRGENVWVMDQISSIATKVRARSSSKGKEEEKQEQIYAEISDPPEPLVQPVRPVQPVPLIQPTHSQNTSEGAGTQTQTGTKTAVLLSGGSVVPEEPTDDDGYAVPPDSPEYLELEDPNKQSTGDNPGAGKLDSHTHQEGSREVAGSNVPSPVHSDAANNRYVTKQRRKPPSPPKKKKEPKENGLDVNDGADVKTHCEEGDDKNNDYESLKDENRDVYQPLDRNTMENR